MKQSNERKSYLRKHKKDILMCILILAALSPTWGCLLHWCRKDCVILGLSLVGPGLLVFFMLIVYVQDRIEKYHDSESATGLAAVAVCVGIFMLAPIMARINAYTKWEKATKLIASGQYEWVRTPEQIILNPDDDRLTVDHFFLKIPHIRSK